MTDPAQFMHDFEEIAAQFMKSAADRGIAVLVFGMTMDGNVESWVSNVAEEGAIRERAIGRLTSERPPMISRWRRVQDG